MISAASLMPSLPKAISELLWSVRVDGDAAERVVAGMIVAGVTAFFQERYPELTCEVG